MTIKERITRLFQKHTPLGPGFHAYAGQRPDGTTYRLHLRIEQGGNAILVINASKVLHLNQTAAEMAKLIIEDQDERAAARVISARYRVSKKQAEDDFRTFKEKIMCLVSSDDVCPVAALDFGRLEPFTMPVSAPYRMDLALTYRCNLSCGHCYAGGPRQTKELNTEEWRQVLDRLYEIGIPHVCFTGGEATLREDLPQLIGYAEDLGLVTGLLTNGCRLADVDYVKTLLEAGLDHVQVTIESHDPQVHNAMVRGEGFDKTVAGIRNAVQAGLYTVTNTTLTRANKDTLAETIRFLHELGVERFAMNGLIYAGRGEGHPGALSQRELAAALDVAADTAAELGMNFIWYTPTRYCELDPLEHGLGMKRCTAGHYNMCIEPDGSVLPCQSYFQLAGNILRDKWEEIWNHQLLQELRQRVWVPAECQECERLDICGGGCPLEKDGARVLCTESLSNF